MRSQSYAWPLADATVFPVSNWTTSTSATDTFTMQGKKGRIGCVATASTVQHAKYSNHEADHSDIRLRGSISWSAVGGDTTNLYARSDLILSVPTQNFCDNNYVFEFDTVAATVVAYKSVAATPTAITGAPAAVAFTYVANTVYNYYLVIIGSFLGFKIWATGTTEPGAWNWSATDPDNAIARTTQGRFGWGNQHNPATATNIELGNFTFQTDRNAPPSRVFDLWTLLAEEDQPLSQGRRPIFRRF